MTPTTRRQRQLLRHLAAGAELSLPIDSRRYQLTGPDGTRRWVQAATVEGMVESGLLDEQLEPVEMSEGEEQLEGWNCRAGFAGTGT